MSIKISFELDVPESQKQQLADAAMLMSAAFSTDRVNERFNAFMDAWKFTVDGMDIKQEEVVKKDDERPT